MVALFTGCGWWPPLDFASRSEEHCPLSYFKSCVFNQQTPDGSEVAPRNVVCEAPLCGEYAQHVGHDLSLRP